MRTDARLLAASLLPALLWLGVIPAPAGAG
jgi:hypothetical protein